MQRIRDIAFVSLLMVTSMLFSAAANASFTGGIGKIAFHGDRHGNYEIYTIPDDSSLSPFTRLTNNTASDLYPSWSPDGKKIAFASNRDGNFEIYTMNADGSAQTRITNNAAADELPAWSPDGTKIAFDSVRNDPQGEIYTMNADGTNVVRITTNPAVEAAPDWSPDGTKIAFMSTRAGAGGGGSEIFTMNTDGTGVTDITNTSSSSESYPSWSPDGAKIAFGRDTGGSSSVYSMNTNGTGLLFHSAGNSPAWKPDGSRLVITWPGDPLADSDLVWSSADGVDGDRITYDSDGGKTVAFPDYQPLNSTYARPRGASPLRIPIMPAMKPCTTPDNNHRGVISGPSCRNPQPESSYLTVGTPDYNGLQANSTGYVLFKVRTTAPEDGLITVNLNDVRCRGTSGGCSNGALSDYTGNLLFYSTFRITDKNNQPGSGLPANGTVAAIVPVYFSVPCSTTASATTGASCTVSTSIESVLGNTAIEDGTRAMWELVSDLPNGRVVEVDDGGPDGVATTFNNTMYGVGGLFFP
jgi:Tol biopolymer transport system component